MWQQVAGDTTFAQFGGKPSDYMVSVMPDETGNAILDVRGETGSFKIHRLH